MGESRTVGVKLKEPINVTAHRRAFRDGKTEIVYNGSLEAPISAGDEVAKLVITLDGKTPVEAPLVATESIARLGFVGKAVEGLSRMIEPGDR